MSKYIISIDQGTTSTRVCLVDQAGSLVLSQSKPFEQIFPKPGWVEHNPEQIWDTTKQCLQDVISKSGINTLHIAGIGITNQRETVVAWNKKTGKPIYNAIVWQCRRTEEFCNQLKKKNKEKFINKTTGLLLDPYFSASKMRWILKNVVHADRLQKQGELCFGTIDSFLLSRLTDGQSFATDVTNASRTMLMNLKTLNWDAQLLKIFGVEQASLPQILPSTARFGVTKGLGILPDGIPICGIAGDQQAALFGQACYQVGEAKCTFGTGSFMLLNTGNKIFKSKSKLLTTVAWQIQGEKPVYALEGGAFICGAAVQWLRDGIGLIKTSKEIEVLAKQVSDSAGVTFVPALTGIGAPYWRPEARGILVGLTRGTTKAHIARATLEAMALQNAEILISMQKDIGKKLSSLKVDGGASSNNLLMQIQADYLGCAVVRPEQIETTAMGAAYLAGVGCGLWRGLKDIQKIWRKDQEFRAQFSQKLRTEKLKSWQKVVKKAW